MLIKPLSIKLNRFMRIIDIQFNSMINYFINKVHILYILSQLFSNANYIILLHNNIKIFYLLFLQIKLLRNI